MELKGKKLLLMGGGAYAEDIKKYKTEKGFECISVGRTEDKRTSCFCEKYFKVDREDIKAISEIVKKEGIDGIFVGSSEDNISSAIEVAEKTGCRFYVSREQWDILSNKAKFKEYSRKFGFPVIPEFHLSDNPSDEEIESLPYPIMIKPTDSSGARGMNPCFSSEDFKRLYNEALSWSRKKEIIVEKLITGAKEVFVNYTIQDGLPTLSYCFTKVKVNTENNSILVPLFHTYPSRYLNEYIKGVNESAKRLIQGIGLQNGTLTLQGFYLEGKFYFFEAGFRMGGAQAYILTDYNNGANVLKYMINYALCGKMSEDNLSTIERADFKYPCCNYYFALKPGIVGNIRGLDEIKGFKSVLNVTEYCNTGTVIEDTNALERIGYRIHVVGNNINDLAQQLVRISSTLKVISDKGEDMQLEQLSMERCLAAINE